MVHEMMIVIDMNVNPIGFVSWLFEHDFGYLPFAVLTFSFTFDPRLALVVLLLTFEFVISGWPSNGHWDQFFWLSLFKYHCLTSLFCRLLGSHALSLVPCTFICFWLTVNVCFLLLWFELHTNICLTISGTFSCLVLCELFALLCLYKQFALRYIP